MSAGRGRALPCHSFGRLSSTQRTGGSHAWPEATHPRRATRVPFFRPAQPRRAPKRHTTHNGTISARRRATWARRRSKRARALNRWPQADRRGRAAGGDQVEGPGHGRPPLTTRHGAPREGRPAGGERRRRKTRARPSPADPEARQRREIAGRRPRTAAPGVPGRPARPGRSKCVRGRSMRRRRPRTPRGAGRSPAGLNSPRAIPTIHTHSPKTPSPSQDAPERPRTPRRPGTV